MCSLVESPPTLNNGGIFTHEPLLYQQPSLPRSNDMDVLLCTDLVLSGQFKDETINMETVNLYLTNTCIVVATISDKLEHLRTHYLKGIKIQEEEQEESLVIKDEEGILYKYTPIKASPIGLWVHKITILQHDTKTIDLSVCSLPSSLLPTCRPPSLRVHRPSHEWHGEQLNIISNTFLQTSGDDDYIKEKSSSLKRRQAFRSPDRLRFGKHRASSAPPDKDQDNDVSMTTSPRSSSSDRLLSPVSTTKSSSSSSSSAPSSLRKKKLKFPPGARKFTRALSAKLMNTSLGPSSSSAHSSPKLSKKEFQRNHSFQSDLPSSSRASLPRTLPNKYIVRKNHSMYIPNSPEHFPPTTPTRLRSPGNLFRIFQRKRIYSVTPQHSYDSDTIDGINEGCSPSSSSNHSDRDHILQRSPQYKLYCHNPKVIAQELVLIDSELFRKIKLDELRDGAWTKKTKQVTSPNVLNMIESFNHLARLVCTDIVHEKSITVRAKAISTYIQLARECYRLHNYNSMKAIISGLQSQPVYRLTRSWNHVPSRRRKKYVKLSQLCSDMDNATIQNEMFTNLQTRIQCIPYLGWLLTSILHWQVYSKLHRTKRTRSASLSGRDNKKKWNRSSVCSISMPASPIQPAYCLEEEEEERRDVLPLVSPVLLHFSKSLNDIPSNNIYSIITHPLEIELPEQTPPLSEDRKYMRGRSPSCESDDNYSYKGDSTIGLDSSMASPLRVGTASNTKIEHSLQSSNNHFDSYDSDEEEEGEGEESQQNSFIDQTNVSSSSSSTSFLSPSMITLSIKQDTNKRRVTMPHIPHPHPLIRNSTIYYDFRCGGVLFSTCCLVHEEHEEQEDTSTRRRLDEVARQLFITHQQQDSDISPNKTPICDTQKGVVSPPSSPPTRNGSLARQQQDVLVLFEQYQVNTLNYLTDYCTNVRLRKLIINSPCVDDNECYKTSLEIEP